MPSGSGCHSCTNFAGAWGAAETSRTAITNAITIGSYMSMFTSTVLLVGLSFEFPTVIWLLSRLGILTRAQLRQGRRYAIVAVLVLAAVVTPADPLSMFIVATPLYLLYEISILLCSKSPESPEADA